ncbi:MAG TPA: thiamine pyrophosphate-dependent enzyme [Alphaproteobacteria bacterium]|nr:thiamine pyrophosphate-dependent enzyme [Alphaproteobacteria bacterium]
MAKTGGDLLVETLIRWGVDVVFGLPGDGINGIMEALRTRQDQIRFIQVRHEEAAAFAACGYAKMTGRLGCCLATSGPGGLHLLTGLYDAKMDRAPVLAITGMPYHDLIDTETQQDVALDRVFADVAAFNTRVMGPTHIENAITQACRTALADRAVAHVAVPVNFQSQEMEKAHASKRNVAHHVSFASGRNVVVPCAAELDRAAEWLNRGNRIAILAGQGALGARAELMALSERLQAPIAKALLGKAAFPDDHPNCTGGVGHLGTEPSQRALEQCDTLLIVGSGFPYIEYYPKPGQARAIQVDIDAARIGLRYPVEVGLVGDAAATIEALLPRLDERRDRAFLTHIQSLKRAWNEQQDKLANIQAKPLKPQTVARALSDRMADDAIVVTDSGTNTMFAARFIEMRGERRFAVSGTLASMGCGIPYAVAAAIANPGRQVVAFVGDGGLSMLMGDLATCAKYRLLVKIVVVKNNSLGQIKWEQLFFVGNPEFGCELQPIDFAKVAEACGLKGLSVEDSGDCGRAVDALLRHDGPALLEATVDPDEPFLSPVPIKEEVENFEKALKRGTPHAERIRQLYNERASPKIAEPVG